MTKKMSPEFYTLLEEIQAIDFVIVELNLYLDTHPHDYTAIQQFNENTEKSMKLKVNFEQKFGPLMNFGRSYSDYPFNWVDTPWPWQV
ncbi:spore coat protein CotJB [Lysinibacillus sphaericus]|uniref:Protein cotJB n=3 Tax=Lysinibacillus TaxID=400634 RepID=B1HTK7_LYSSC|nr:MULTISPECIES: spore coat protein CotJB [Lysinibacillus]MBE5083001.1 spore coat protein CotJB [Bacillus thuringiensis]ACA41211.1 Protein cotJB [Lysinibacillus sphaericus C3-41]AMO32875.1 cotJB protein [Lysinibacillus sphaericus]AMR92022.1 cotJB protein [Lysinibacillus sphaericus]ANA46070.1 cotJB protein [Lysinibacillus sphaericus]